MKMFCVRYGLGLDIKQSALRLYMVKRFNLMQVYDTTELSKNVREKLFNGQVSKAKRILNAVVSQTFTVTQRTGDLLLPL
jgi:hypothetical protein